MLRELCDLVIKEVLKKTGAHDLDDDFEKLKILLEKALEVDKVCHRNAVKQFLFNRRISKDIADIREGCNGLVHGEHPPPFTSFHVTVLHVVG